MPAIEQLKAEPAKTTDRIVADSFGEKEAVERNITALWDTFKSRSGNYLQNKSGAGNENCCHVGTLRQLRHHFTGMAVHSLPVLTIQPKLAVNAPDDEYEMEADAVSEKIMRMPETATQPVNNRTGTDLHIKPGNDNSEKEEELEMEEEPERAVQKIVHRKFAGGGDDDEDDRSGNKNSGQATPSITPNVQQALQSPGQSLDQSARSFMEQRFGFDFSKVQIHNNSLAHQSAKDINALAYTHQNDIVFGVGQYQPQTQSGKKLLAHELTHVLQQGKKNTVQRMASMDLNGGKVPPSSPDPEKMMEEILTADVNTPGNAEAKFIVDDNTEPGEGQMQKTGFLNALNEAICQTVESALLGSKYTSENCPYIRAVFAKYKDRSPLYIEQLINHYAHVPDSAKSTDDLISVVQARVMSSVKMWLKTGDMIGVPDGIKSEINASMGSEVKPAANDKAAGAVQFKEREGSARNNQYPVTVMQSLGKGNPLEGSTRTKMEDAFNTDFSHVEIHTDSHAAHMASSMNARAFAVGNHIAFGTGEHKPGTLLGDALLAHELAHVEQQKGATGNELMNDQEEKYAEQEADQTAMKVMFKTYGKKGKKHTNGVKLNRGLSLQKCDYGPDFSEMSAEEQQLLREEILTETELDYDPDPEREDIYEGTTMSISLYAPTTFYEGSTEYPFIQSLAFEFPDGFVNHRQVYSGGNQFMTVGEGLHKITGTIKYMPDMLPATFEKRINVVKLRTLTDKVAQEDIDANKRGDSLFSELLGFQNLSGSMREKALLVGLPDKLLLLWYETNAQAIIIEGLLKENKTVDSATHSAFVAKFNSFGDEFRKTVAGLDYKVMEDVYVGEGQTEEQEVTKNPFMSPVRMDYYKGIVSAEKVAVHVKTGLFLSLTKDFDLYIEDLFKKGGDPESGKTLVGAGITENALRSLYVKHGNLQPLKANFYPTEQSQLEGGVKPGDTLPENYRAKKFDLRFYTYKTVDGSTVTWHLIDATNPERVLETEEDGDSTLTPPDTLFTELDNATRFPTGVLYWQMPGQDMRSYDIVHPLTFSQFLTYLGIGLAILGITLATAGAGTAATVFFVASGIAGAAGAIADMAEKDNVGTLTTRDIVFDVLTIATSLLSAGTAAAGRVVATGVGATGNYARLAVGLDKIYRPLAGITLAADMISLAVFTVDFASQLNTVIDSSQLTGNAKKEALVRLIFQGLITGGLTLLAVKGSISDFNRGRSLYLDLTPTGPKARFVLPDTNLLGSSLTVAKKAELEALFKKLDTPANQSQLFQLKAELSAALESGVVKQSEISSFIDDITAGSGDIAKIEKRIADFRAKNMEAVKADFEAYKQTAKGKGLTDKQAEVSYDALKSVSKETPKQIVDKTKTLDQQVDQLYEQAKVADAELKGVVNNVSGETGGEVGFRPADINNGLKGRERAMEKINQDYGGDPSFLVDISGAQITFTKIDDLYKAVKKLFGQVNVVKFKDTIIGARAKSGYGDVKLSLKMSNGHIVELKLLLKEVEEISSREHALYEIVRSRTKPGVEPVLTAEEKTLLDAYKVEYDAAFSKMAEQNK
jgi:hypothetical protein